jgi:hypothetical protein
MKFKKRRSMAPHEGPPPVHAWKCELNGVGTDVVLVGYSNKTLVIISQTGKMGTIMHVDVPSELGGGAVETQTLIGHRDNDALDVYARRVYETVCAKAGVPLVLSLALREYTPANLAALVAELQRATGSTPSS